MKELELTFEGRGEVKGYVFNQLKTSINGFLYELKDHEGNVHYEVFRRKENKQFNCISYPKSNSFGIWAWCTKDYKKAISIFNDL